MCFRFWYCFHYIRNFKEISFLTLYLIVLLQIESAWIIQYLETKWEFLVFHLQFELLIFYICNKKRTCGTFNAVTFRASTSFFVCVCLCVCDTQWGITVKERVVCSLKHNLIKSNTFNEIFSVLKNYKYIKY